jgi:alanine racemase
MDMMMIDLEPCPQAGIGSRVELWGNEVKIDDTDTLWRGRVVAVTVANTLAGTDLLYANNFTAERHYPHANARGDLDGHDDD